MSIYHVDTQVEADFADRLAVDELIRLVESVLKQEKQPTGVSLTLVITDDQHIRALNRDFRGVDRSTDVLAFGDAEDVEFVTAASAPPYLGDVVVSYSAASAQAAERGYPVEKELALLVVHGVLHLLGYGHSSESERQLMWARQEEILRHWH